VRGLNSRLHRDAAQELIWAERLMIVCFHETKLSVISDYDASYIIGVGFDCFYLPDVGIRGGILVAWRSFILVGELYITSSVLGLG
jgi:hypothetical protein